MFMPSTIDEFVSELYIKLVMCKMCWCPVEIMLKANVKHPLISVIKVDKHAWNPISDTSLVVWVFKC